MAISGSSMPRTAELSIAKEQIDRLETRSRSLTPEEEQEREYALKKAARTQKRLQMRVSISVLYWTLGIVTVVLAFLRAFPEGVAIAQSKGLLAAVIESFAWLLKAPDAVAQGTGGDLYTLWAPFLSVALAMERLLETGFNWFEQTSRAVADILVAPRDALDWIGREYQDAYKATKDATETLSIETTPETMEVAALAEERLFKAEQRLRGWTSAPEYLAWKKALSIWVGLLVGTIVAVVGDLGMLRYIGISCPRFIDMILTGLLVGAGPGPMHDIIGILQGGKNAVSNLAELAKGKAVREAAFALKSESETLHERKTITENVMPLPRVNTEHLRVENTTPTVETGNPRVRNSNARLEKAGTRGEKVRRPRTG